MVTGWGMEGKEYLKARQAKCVCPYNDTVPTSKLCFSRIRLSVNRCNGNRTLVSRMNAFFQVLRADFLLFPISRIMLNEGLFD